MSAPKGVERPDGLRLCSSTELFFHSVKVPLRDSEARYMDKKANADRSIPPPDHEGLEEVPCAAALCASCAAVG